MMNDLVFLKLCEGYEITWLHRDSVRCTADRNGESLLDPSKIGLEAAVINYPEGSRSV